MKTLTGLAIKLSVIATLFVTMVTISSPARLVYAQSTDGPLLLAPLPGTFNDNTAEPRTTLREYLPGLFKLSIALAALIAVVVIIFAGLEYMFSTSSGGTGRARQRITAAVSGLIMVLAAWLILQTINPKLVNFNLNIQPTRVVSAPTSPVTPPDQQPLPQLYTTCNTTRRQCEQVLGIPPAGHQPCDNVSCQSGGGGVNQCNPQGGRDEVGFCRQVGICDNNQPRANCESIGAAWSCTPC